MRHNQRPQPGSNRTHRTATGGLAGGARHLVVLVLPVVALVLVPAPVPTSPPSYMWGYGDPFICGEPPANVTLAAVDASRRDGPLMLGPSASGMRVLLLGDSTACSLWPGLHAVGDANRIPTDQGSVFGCGIAVDVLTTTRSEQITPHSDRCRPFLDYTVPRALARSQPTVVVWMSVWEKSDLVENGRTIVAGTAEWEQAIMARMDVALARLTAGGAHVVMVTEAAPAFNPTPGARQASTPVDDAGYVRLNGLLRRFAARHPDQVSLVDLAAKLCPTGPPCPALVEGMQARPDGRHFTPEAATWAARWLLQQIAGSGHR